MKRCYPHSDRKNDRYYLNPAFAIRRAAAAAFSKECYVNLGRKVKAKFLQEFYVYGPRMEDGSLYGRRQLTKYVARYASHPAISASRIDSFDRETEMVSWHYESHEDEGKEEWEKQGTRHVTEHAFEFIKRLIVHIPDPEFRQVRYYGFYANKRKAKQARKKRCLDSEITGRKAETAWRSRLGGTYGFDPMVPLRYDNGTRPEAELQSQARRPFVSQPRTGIPVT